MASASDRFNIQAQQVGWQDGGRWCGGGGLESLALLMLLCCTTAIAPSHHSHHPTPCPSPLPPPPPVPAPAAAAPAPRHRPQEHLQSKYVGTGHPDINRFEWNVNIKRDTYASFIGHHSLAAYHAIAENESIGRVKYNFQQNMLLPCGLPPLKPEDDAAS